MADWHRKTFANVIGLLDSDAARGLTNEQVVLRYAEHGPNELVETGGRGP